jgi:hypothetical protein
MEIFGLILGLLFILIPLVMLAAMVFLLVFWILMLIDAIKRPLAEQEKIVWIIVLALTGFIGAIIYYFLVRRGKPSIS